MIINWHLKKSIKSQKKIFSIVKKIFSIEKKNSSNFQKIQKKIKLQKTY